MHSKTVHLAVDMMSGDSGLRITIPAVFQALQDFPRITLHLTGDSSAIEKAVTAWPDVFHARVNIIHAPDCLAGDVNPATVLKKDHDSSASAALKLVSDGVASAVISAGNAGALMILARKIIGVLQDNNRPALCSQFPTETGFSLLLDLGANVDCSAEQLQYFAVLGSALHSALYAGAQAKVGLLSNGVEATKGNAVVRRAAQYFSDAPDIDYRGYIEANQLHRGEVDVVVVDGFVGNIALKAIEGTAEIASNELKRLVDASSLNGDLAQEILQKFALAMDPELHNGAFLLGLSGVVVKAHGDSSVEGFVSSIAQALLCEELSMTAKMKHCLDSNMI
ncbi:MAG: phosphate acyltransferase PlsX [Halioglobus sp.]